MFPKPFFPASLFSPAYWPPRLAGESGGLPRFRLAQRNRVHQAGSLPRGARRLAVLRQPP